MAIEVICDGDQGTPTCTEGATISFVPPTTISVSSGTEIGVDGNACALESDIDSTMSSAYVALAGVGTDASVGTASYNQITGITTSSVLTKGGTAVVLKVTVNFELTCDATWVIPPPPPSGTPSQKYVSGYVLPCTLTWTTVQSKLRA